MTIDFLIGAIRASRDLHPQVKTELEEILYRAEPVEPKEIGFKIPVTIGWSYECECEAPVLKEQPYCMNCGRRIAWE